MKLYLLAFVTCLVSLNLSELIGRNIEYDTTYVLSKSEIVIDLSPKARIHETNVLNFIDSGTLNIYVAPGKTPSDYIKLHQRSVQINVSSPRVVMDNILFFI